VSRDHKVIVLNNQIMNWRDRKIEFQCIPIRAIIDREVHAKFGSGKQEPFPDWIFANRTHKRR